MIWFSLSNYWIFNWNILAKQHLFLNLKQLYFIHIIHGNYFILLIFSPHTYVKCTNIFNLYQWLLIFNIDYGPKDVERAHCQLDQVSSEPHVTGELRWYQWLATAPFLLGSRPSRHSSYFHISSLLL